LSSVSCLPRHCSYPVPPFYLPATSPTVRSTLSLHDALPICSTSSSAPRCSASTTGTRTCRWPPRRSSATRPTCPSPVTGGTPPRSEEHTSELQSRFDLVCRLLLEKKKTEATSDAKERMPSCY